MLKLLQKINEPYMLGGVANLAQFPPNGPRFKTKFPRLGITLGPGKPGQLGSPVTVSHTYQQHKC